MRARLREWLRPVRDRWSAFWLAADEHTNGHGTNVVVVLAIVVVAALCCAGFFAALGATNDPAYEPPRSYQTGEPR